MSVSLPDDRRGEQCNSAGRSLRPWSIYTGDGSPPSCVRSDIWPLDRAVGLNNESRIASDEIPEPRKVVRLAYRNSDLAHIRLRQQSCCSS